MATKEKKTIEQELQEATGIKASKDRPAYLKKLHKAVMELDDEEWDKLSAPAQKWANANSKLVEADEDLGDFPETKVAEAAEETSEEEDDMADKKAASKPAKKSNTIEAVEDAPAKKTVVAKAKATAKEKAAPAPKAKRAPGKIEKMKGIILKNLKLKPEELKAKLTAAGIDGVADTTITTVRSDFLGSIRVLQKAGKLSEDLVDLD